MLNSVTGFESLKMIHNFPFSQRRIFLSALETCVRGRLKTHIAWPDLLLHINQVDIDMAYREMLKFAPPPHEWIKGSEC